MRAEYLGHFGSDLMVVDCARVSFDRKSAFVDIASADVPEIHARSDSARHYRDYLDHQHTVRMTGVLSFADFKLIRFLAVNGHWSPFSHPTIQFRISVPVAIGAQLKRHTVGLAINEVSRRYVDDAVAVYTPISWRKRPDGSIKQGSSSETVERVWPGTSPAEAYKIAVEQAQVVYEHMIKAGVAPEMARFVLPQGMYTRWIWTGSLYAYARVCKQRTPNGHAQHETSVVADEIHATLVEIFPASWPALVAAGSTA